MRRSLVLAMVALVIGGCGLKQNDLDRALQKEENIHLTAICIDKVFEREEQKRDIFKRFPFISLKPEQEIRGKFSDDFYASLNLVYNAKDIAEVDFWKLQKNPKMLDFIYIKPLWIKEYRKIGDDLLENIAYSYNISKKEQEILRSWIAQGGKLWVEFGTFSTKYDVFNKYGEIATKRIDRLVRQSFAGVRFFQKPVYTYVFKSKNIDMINYLPSYKTFRIDTKRSYFKDIKRLKIDLDNYMQNDFVASGKALVVDRQGRVLVSEIPYGEGSVVTLLPFEYRDVYYDGELLRWELLFYLYGKR